MQAVVYPQLNALPELTSFPDPTPPDDGIVLKVAVTGLCRSDWHTWKGHFGQIPLPMVPGHEMAGSVVAVGKDVHGWETGERVTLPFALGCGLCTSCQAGHTHLCEADLQPGYNIHGSFAEYVAIPRANRNLVRLPSNVSHASAAALGCRFTTAFRAVIDQGRLRPGEWLVVFGSGGLGLSAVMIAVSAGARVIAVDHQPEALQLAASLGAQHTLLASQSEALSEAILDYTRGGAQLIVDAVGAPGIARIALQSLIRRGRFVQVGYPADEPAGYPLPLGLLMGRELEILGSHGMPAHGFPRLLEMIAAGRLDPARLVTHRISLAEAPNALAAMDGYSPGVTQIDL